MFGKFSWKIAVCSLFLDHKDNRPKVHNRLRKPPRLDTPNRANNSAELGENHLHPSSMLFESKEKIKLAFQRAFKKKKIGEAFVAHVTESVVASTHATYQPAPTPIMAANDGPTGKSSTDTHVGQDEDQSLASPVIAVRSDPRVKIFDPVQNRFTIWKPQLTLIRLLSMHGEDSIHDGQVEAESQNADEITIETSPDQSITQGKEPIHDNEEVDQTLEAPSIAKYSTIEATESENDPNIGEDECLCSNTNKYEQNNEYTDHIGIGHESRGSSSPPLTNTTDNTSVMGNGDEPERRLEQDVKQELSSDKEENARISGKDGSSDQEESHSSIDTDHVRMMEGMPIEASNHGSDVYRDTVGDNSSYNNSEHEEEYINRSDWEPLRSIPNDNFIKILAQHVQGSDDPEEDHFRFINLFEGGYNHVRMFEITSGVSAGTYVIKIPAVGTANRWQEQDAYMLRSEFGTMKLIHEQTQCPVPEVIACDDSLTNVLGAPFIIMKACSGVSGYDIWFDRRSDNTDDMANADFPSPARLRKRENFLKSLARAMSELQSLSFDKIGILDFDNLTSDGSPSIGACWYADMDAYRSQEDLFTDKCLREAPVYMSSQDLFIAGLRASWVHNTLEGGHVLATEYILDEIFRLAPFAHSSSLGHEKESFVLRHDDLNFQNIFCDPETGEVTGIIDWERCTTSPRCIGFASLPIFLTKDWFPGYTVATATHHFWALEMYRDIYAKEMIAATGSGGDGRYTAKSTLYQAAYGALYGGCSGGSIWHFVRYLLRQTPGLHAIQEDEFLDWLGNDRVEHGQYVLKKLEQLIAPDVSTTRDDV